jgi:hypothetical protein
MNTDPASEISLQREKRLLRRTGWAVLVAGTVVAALVYSLGKSAEDNNDLAQGQRRAESRQLGLLYGKSGEMAEDFFSALKRPEIQAGAIVVITFAASFACFYLGRPARPSGNDS